MSKPFLCCLFLLILVVLPVNAQQQVYNVSSSASVGVREIDWTMLNLSDEQLKRIKELDAQWKGLEQSLRPKIIRDQQQLKNVMNNPNVNEDKIRQLQKDIMLRQDNLRYAATENFLSKRRLLNTDQRAILHKMMTQK